MRRFVVVAACCLLIPTACSRDTTDLLDIASGGDTTTPLANRNAFGSPAPNLSAEEQRLFEIGNSFFTQPWVTAPATADVRDGLGPLFNAPACSSCHVLDGRGAPPSDDAVGSLGLLLRVGIMDAGVMSPVPGLGDQLQDEAIHDVPSEGSLTVAWTEVPGRYADGTPFTLRNPTYGIQSDTVFPAGMLTSPRIAPQVIGLGLIEAIPESAILDAEDLDDHDGDGISGRSNHMVSASTGETMLGRFGWKANVPLLIDQIADALLADIGLTTPVHPFDNCLASQPECLSAPNGGTPEIDQERLDKIVFYAATLAVPQRRNVDDDDVIAGADLFDSLSCSVCHVPRFQTGDHAIAALRYQTIFPFSDFLLHDMGPGLADGKPDGRATGTEWRTPPLWGIGLVDTVNGHTYLLHDGRARGFEEAILWHGGEAQASRDGFTALDADDRARLIAFLDSL